MAADTETSVVRAAVRCDVAASPVDAAATYDLTASLEEGRCPGLEERPPQSPAAVDSRGRRHPLVRNVPQAALTMRFVKLEKLKKLRAPFPRCQDLPEDVFGYLRPRDKLVAISHGWRFQMHPDPYGCETEELNALLTQIEQTHRSPGTEIYCFLDFLAIPQRPFAKGQSERTETEEFTFQQALQHLDAVFLYADAIVHLDVPCPMPDGEGELFVDHGVPVENLDLRQVGVSVQCTGRGMSDPACPGFQPFDIVESINGHLVKNLADVMLLLEEEESATVAFRRHPFGVPNQVGCSERGWIYLERFITMVVAALEKDENFKGVVYSGKVEILQEIHAGASYLRQNARKDALYRSHTKRMSTRAHRGATPLSDGDGDSVVKAFSCGGTVQRASALELAFESFEEQLQMKKFSAASVDKAMNANLRTTSTLAEEHVRSTLSSKSDRSGDSYDVGADDTPDSATPASQPSSDAELVATIMLKLVGHLRTQWTEEEKMRGERMLDLRRLKEYVVEWDSFTPAYVERIQTAMAGSLCSLFLLLGLFFAMPLALCFSVVLAPYARPDSGLAANWLHWCYTFPWISCICFFYVPQWLQVCMNVELPLRCTLGWPVLAAILTSIPIPAISTLAGVYPVPFSPILSAAFYIFTLPILWYMIPRVLRARSSARHKFGLAVLGQILCSTIFCIGYPLLNIWLKHAGSLKETVFLVFIFLGVRILYEKGCESLSAGLSTDVLPAAVFLAEVCYQCAMCDFFSHVDHLPTCLVLSVAGLLENAYYLYCFQHGTLANDSSGTPIAQKISRAFSGASSKSAATFCDGSSASVAAVLLLRHLADILVPLQFIVVFSVLHGSSQAPFNTWAAQQDVDGLARTILYLCMNIAMELLLGVLTYIILHSRGVRPLAFLRGVIVGGNFMYYLAAATTGLLWFSSLQIVQNGCDFTFRFSWVVYPNMKWIVGTQWA